MGQYSICVLMLCYLVLQAGLFSFIGLWNHWHFPSMVDLRTSHLFPLHLHPPYAIKILRRGESSSLSILNKRYDLSFSFLFFFKK